MQTAMKLGLTMLVAVLGVAVVATVAKRDTVTPVGAGARKLLTGF